ncbi:MAG: R2-like ligand-binding oxidase [Acidobacteriota bacterium]
MAREGFQTTSSRGLDYDLPPMRLWRKSKEHGIWNPELIDFTQDREDWTRLDDLEREVILHLTSLFQAGEEAVTLDLLPLIMTVAEEGRLEEEMYLTAFLWEEAKHVELFRRFLDEVADTNDDLSRFHSPSYRTVFYEALPEALDRLRADRSPVAQAEASVTYNMIVEGVLAETGYQAYHEILVRNELMPGMQEAVGYLKRDESRHMAYGVYLLSRLVAEHGDEVWNAIEARMSTMLMPAIGVIGEIFATYEEMPFGLELDSFTEYALSQFQRRMARIEKARNQTLAEVSRSAAAA